MFGCDWAYEELKKYERELDTLINSDGVIFLHYVMAFLKDDKRFRKGIINNSAVATLDLNDEEMMILPPFNSITNAMILKRTHKL